MGSLLRALKECLLFVLFHCGGARLIRLLTRLFIGNGLRVLYCHRVLPDSEGADPPSWRRLQGHMTQREFSRCIRYLRRHYSVIPLSDGAAMIRGERPLIGNGVVLTFDDGYADNFHYALPILRRHGLSATFFLSSGFLGTGRSPWFQGVYNALGRTDAAALTLNGRRFALRGAQERINAMRAAVDPLKRVSSGQRRRAVAGILSQLEEGLDRPEPQDRMLNWDEVRSMATDPLVILGSHTVTHPVLAMTSPAMAAWEINGSMEHLVPLAANGFLPFSYPSGHTTAFTDKHKRMVREAGYSCACSTLKGLNFPGDDLYSLKRHGFDRMPFYRFSLYVAGLWDLSDLLKFRAKKVLVRLGLSGGGR